MKPILRPSRFLAIFACGALHATGVTAQSPTVATFREQIRSFGERVVLAVEAMPAERYGFAPTQRQPAFATVATNLGQQTFYFCRTLTGRRPPQLRSTPDESPKTQLIAGLRLAYSWCDSVSAPLTDAALLDTISISMRDDGWAPRVRTRAAAMALITAYWANAYAQLGHYLRLNGRVPPVPCGRPTDDSLTCDSGLPICRPTRAGVRGPLQGFLDDSGRSVTSDGRGPYIGGQGGLAVFAGHVLVFHHPQANAPGDHGPPRTIRVDLTRPVPRGGGTALGVIESQNMEVMSQWHAEWQGDSVRIPRSMLDIPVGGEVDADQTNVVFAIGGVRHALQMGPQVLGHCYQDGSSMTGVGTTRARIRRVTTEEWVVDLPEGSVGRLFDIHVGEPNAVDRGLYYVSLRMTITR